MSKRIDQFADPITNPSGIKLGGIMNGQDIGVTVGAPNGIPPLGSDQKIPAQYLPGSAGGTVGAVVYMGTWDASSANPPAASPQKGQYWVVSVAGTYPLNGIKDWRVGDWAIYDGTAWAKVDNTDTEDAITYTGTALTLADTNDRNVISCNNAAAVQIIVPAGLRPDFRCDFEQLGAGQVSVVPETLPAPVQNNLATATSGGSLAAATYYYKVTALNANGETIASNEKSITTTGAASTVTVSWGAVGNATGYRIYRGTAAGVENVFYAPAGLGTSFTDTGAANTPGTSPASNTARTVTINGADAKTKTRVQYSVIGIKRRSDGTFVCYGDRA